MRLRTLGNVHLLNVTTDRVACGPKYNRVAMIASPDPMNTVCVKCKRTRMYSGMMGGNVELPKPRKRVKRTRRITLKDYIDWGVK